MALARHLGRSASCPWPPGHLEHPLNYKKLFRNAVAAQTAGESLVLLETNHTVAVQPWTGGQLHVIPLDQGVEAKVICEDDFQQFAAEGWTIHPNFVALMNQLGENHVA